jgi:cation:H+ antiporter
MGVAPEKLYLDRLVKIGPLRLRLIIPQILIGLAGITGGAYVFVYYIQNVAHHFGVPPLLLSMLVSPIATEAPEKINSILWLRAKKDTLAIGNVTGALVFQSCFPVAFGVAFTAWNLDLGTFLSGVVAIASAFSYFWLLKLDRLKPGNLLCGMFIYVGTLAAIISFGLYKRPIF